MSKYLYISISDGILLISGVNFHHSSGDETCEDLGGWSWPVITLDDDVQNWRIDQRHLLVSWQIHENSIWLYGDNPSYGLHRVVWILTLIHAHSWNESPFLISVIIYMLFIRFTPYGDLAQYELSSACSNIETGASEIRGTSHNENLLGKKTLVSDNKLSFPSTSSPRRTYLLLCTTPRVIESSHG